MTWSQATAACKAKDMKLFQIDGVEIQDAVLAFPPKIYGKSWALRVDGLRNTTDGNWYYDDGKIPAFSGLKWVQSANTPAGHDSLFIGPYNYPDTTILSRGYVDGFPFSRPHYPLCQF